MRGPRLPVPVYSSKLPLAACDPWIPSCAAGAITADGRGRDRRATAAPSPARRIGSPRPQLPASSPRAVPARGARTRPSSLRGSGRAVKRHLPSRAKATPTFAQPRFPLFLVLLPNSVRRGSIPRRTDLRRSSRHAVERRRSKPLQGTLPGGARSRGLRGCPRKHDLEATRPRGSPLPSVTPPRVDPRVQLVPRLRFATRSSSRSR
jgi:hypothetical protein